MDSGLLVDFLRNHYKAKADQLKNKINFNNVTIDTINDRTISSAAFITLTYSDEYFFEKHPLGGIS